MSIEESITQKRASLSAARQALLKKRLQGNDTHDTPKYTIGKRPVSLHPFASFTQQRLWFLQKLNPSSSAYNESTAIHLTGPLHYATLLQVIRDIVQRHEILRTTFSTANGQVIQVIAPVLPEDFSIPVMDMQSSALAEHALQQKICEYTQQPFNFETEFAWRIQLLRISDSEHVFLLVMHHIISDAWSQNLLLGEITKIYAAYSENRSFDLPALPIQFADYTHWQHQRFQEGVLQEQLAYWKDKLHGAPQLLELPTDRARPSVQTNQGSRYPILIPEALNQSLQSLSKQQNVTLFMTLLAVFKVLLYRYSHQSDIIIGSPIAGRTHIETEELIGCFINTLALRTDLNGNPAFSEVLKRVHKTTIDALQNQEVPFEKLVEELQPARSLNHSPLFQVMFSLQNFSSGSQEMREIKATPYEIPHTTAKFDLWLNLQETSQGLEGHIEYNTDLFDQITIDRLWQHFLCLMAGILAHPDQQLSELPLLTAEDQHQLLDQWNATQADLPSELCLHHLIEAQARRTPDRIACLCEDEKLTYRQLNDRANSLAFLLQEKGVGPDVLVGICLERTVDLLVALLAVLKAGGAYVPLDPTYPPDRLSYMLQDAEALVLLTHTSLAAHLPEARSEVLCLDTDWQPSHTLPPQSTVKPAHLAYVIYTSGSTGKPKGVQIPHGAVVNFLLSMQRSPGITAQDVLLAITTISFDIAALELFLPLTVGACVVLARREITIDGKALSHAINSFNVTLLQATPATWQLLLDAGWQGKKDMRMLCGGEALSTKLATRLVRYGAELWNMYGPTETTIWSTTMKIEPAQPVITVGKPIMNTQTYILNAYKHPVPIGVTGDLYIGGVGLARGYSHLPQTTTQQFIPHPFSNEPGGRLYKTGDIARYHRDGNIEILGRADHQVKVRGFRIELGEIESVLLQYAAVREAVVITQDDGYGARRLIAYVVLKDTEGINALRAFMLTQLPPYMLPTVYIPLDHLPRTSNGKIDRLALPSVHQQRAGQMDDLLEPRSDVERTIATVWQEVLHLEKVGINHNFFDLGGHSLLFIQIQSKLHTLLGREIAILDLLRYPTISLLADALKQAPQATTPFQTISAQALKQRNAIARQKQYVQEVKQST